MPTRLSIKPRAEGGGLTSISLVKKRERERDLVDMMLSNILCDYTSAEMRH